MRVFGLPPKSAWLWVVAVIIVFLVAYPKPHLFVRTVHRYIRPPIEPAEVAEISATLPGDPAKVEEWVVERIRRDANDYANWGVIFYIASPSEVLSIGRGPCYGRAVVLASILEAKGIPYQYYLMPGHFWIEYEGREPLFRLEEPKNATLRWEDGRWHFQGLGWVLVLPEMLGIQARLYWRIVPWAGKVAVLVVIVGVFYLRWLRRRFEAKARGEVS